MNEIQDTLAAHVFQQLYIWNIHILWTFILEK